MTTYAPLPARAQSADAKNSQIATPTQSGALRIKIIDENGQPLPGAFIRVRSRYHRFGRAAETGADGIGTIHSLPPGKYDLWADLEDHVPVTLDNIKILANTETIEQIQMKAGDDQLRVD